MRNDEPYLLALENAKIPKSIKDETVNQKELWENTHPQFFLNENDEGCGCHVHKD